MANHPKTPLGNSPQQPRPAPPRASTSPHPWSPRRRQNNPYPRTCLFEKWNTGPHITGYVDFAESIENYHPKRGHSYPWTSWTTTQPPKLVTLKAQLESCLESMTKHAIKLGTISSHQILTTLNKWHSPNTILNRILNVDSDSKTKMRSVTKKNRLATSSLWDTAVFRYSAGLSEQELDEVLDKQITVDEGSYHKEAMAALKLAKEVLRIQGKWRENAIRDLNSRGGFSRPLANSATNWPSLLLELLSLAAEVDYFQPKLVINNIELLKNAVSEDDTTIYGPMYHDSLIWRIIALGANERCLPVFFVTSDSYYSYKAFIDFGFPDIFISRETFGWTPAEAKLHVVGDYFSPSEWNLIVEVLGPNPRHLFEVYALKLSNDYQKLSYDNTFEDIVDLYLAYVQVNVVNPAMNKALLLLEKFAVDAQSGKISKDRLRFGSPWRHPPKTDIGSWTKIQLMDFVQSLVNAGFAVNYFADWSLEFLDDPSAVALLEGWFIVHSTRSLIYSPRHPWYSEMPCEMACPRTARSEL
ncbi:hypothetical protein CASFOL_027145 [Castilleja foliolosa]|uniref:Uncharacterized protein n=1 Tax=Castilleja foliolosa TaxID=1961234 RepID=A0ABD3CHR6_9LAMI